MSQVVFNFIVIMSAERRIVLRNIGCINWEQIMPGSEHGKTNGMRLIDGITAVGSRK